MENGGLCVKQEPLELDWEEEEESFDYEAEENNKSFDDGIDVGDSTEDFAVKLEPHVTIKQEDTELYHDLDHRVAGTSTQGKDIFKCNKCYISYENKFSYRNHVNSCQKQIVRFPLEGCEPWRGAGDMKESIKILEKSCFLNETWDETDLQSGDSTESFECLECENSYPNIKCFARHIYAHTFVKKPVEDQRHVCADCGKEFESKSKVDAHVKRSRKCANTPKVVFACLICRKIFTRKDNLRDHLKVHAGFPRTKKKYECKKCGKSFGSTTLLTIHARVHMGLRALSCKICKKTVTSKGALQKHMQVHKGEQY